MIFWFMDKKKKDTAILPVAGWNIFFPSEEETGRTKLFLKQKTAGSKIPSEANTPDMICISNTAHKYRLMGG